MSIQPPPSAARGLLNSGAPPAEFSPALAGVRHAFFGREGGVSTGIYASLNAGPGSNDTPGAVSENRRRIATAFGVPPSLLIGVHQVHSADAVFVDASWPGERPNADAMVTTRSGVALSVLTADCAPVLLADAEAGVIAAAHAGWKGALTGILEATVQLMCAHGASAARIGAAIGPCIHQASYEVGPEFQSRFLSADPASARFFTPGRGDRLQFDLPGFCAKRLRTLGLAQVEILSSDTCALPTHYFSHRRAARDKASDYGRNCAAIALG